ncbi:MAG: hypothetical protein V1681_06250 [Candidatus Neomarinimicrobiota bacterium]
MEINDQATLHQYIDNTPDTYLMPLQAALSLADGEYQAAIDLCRRDLTIHPYSAIGHFIWALTAQAMNDIDEAVAHLQSTIAADSYFLQAYYKLIELGQGYLNPYQLKHYYEQICRINPFDPDIAAKLAAMPADLEMLSAQMKIKPPVAPKVEPPVAAPAIKPKPEEAPVAPPTEAEPLHGAEQLSKFFESLKQATELPKPPVVTAEPSIPEEEAHMGPVDLPETKPAMEDMEPINDFETPTMDESSEETAARPEKASSINDLFSRLRNKPLEEVQKENWMLERETTDNPSSPVPSSPVSPPPPPQPAPQPPTPQAPPPPAASVPPTPAPDEPLAADLVSRLQNMLTPEPSESPAPEVPEIETPMPSDVSTEQDFTEEQPVEITEDEPKPIATPETTSPPKKRAQRPAKKNSGQTNNISFPIPTWTLVDVLTKQKLYEQALSILDIIETKSKKPADLTKVQENRAEISRLMAEEQSGEA